jgi:uncharacterized protein YjbJ (UPF0337 family)
MAGPFGAWSINYGPQPLRFRLEHGLFAEQTSQAGIERKSTHIAGVCRMTQEVYMDWNRVDGNWKQVKGKVKEKWGNLTDDDLDKIAGRRDQLEGKIQERYGIAKDQAKKDIDSWYSTQTW